METNAKPAEPHDPATYWLAPSRNYRTSARLYFQHMLCQNTLGFLLENHIEQAIPRANTSVLQVADLACGNGVWLVDLCGELAKKCISAKLDGFDINEILFPAPALLPPPELIGIYDVVHIRAFTSMILNAETTSLLSTVLAMLKPGGWIQWEEINPDCLVELATPGLETSACETLKRGLRTSAEPHGHRYEYLAELDKHLIKNGFEDVHMSKMAKRKEDYKAWTDDFLMIWEEATPYFPSNVTNPHAPITREFWAKNLIRAVGETEKGVVLHAGIITTVVGRKPILS
ncbi:S-adenosyl-L-methionine-dependent methyltransferase [Xylaria sp. FL0043]|nr:S-adenosyl-L-methionine-dependent methyltransferase [Xylaria sp. FL0043]